MFFHGTGGGYFPSYTLGRFSDAEQAVRMQSCGGKFSASANLTVSCATALVRCQLKFPNRKTGMGVISTYALPEETVFTVSRP